MTKAEIERPQHPGPQGLSLLKALLEFARTPLEFCLKYADQYEGIVSLALLI